RQAGRRTAERPPRATCSLAWTRPRPVVQRSGHPGRPGLAPSRRSRWQDSCLCLPYMNALGVVRMADPGQELVQLRRERDLFSRLLALGRQDEPEPFLSEALGLIVEVTDARQGYLELHGDDPETPRWSLGHGFTSQQLDGVRAVISRGIIAEALATGKTIVTDSAMLDERFRGLDSVKFGHIEAVLCAPIGDDPPRGVLYLQKPASRLAFTDDDRARAETFAWHLAPLADRVLTRYRQRAVTDHTALVRDGLRATDVIRRSVPPATAVHQAA